jgi:hypothetical protein
LRLFCPFGLRRSTAELRRCRPASPEGVEPSTLGLQEVTGLFTTALTRECARARRSRGTIAVRDGACAPPVRELALRLPAPKKRTTSPPAVLCGAALGNRRCRHTIATTRIPRLTVEPEPASRTPFGGMLHGTCRNRRESNPHSPGRRTGHLHHQLVQVPGESAKTDLTLRSSFITRRIRFLHHPEFVFRVRHFRRGTVEPVLPFRAPLLCR